MTLLNQWTALAGPDAETVGRDLLARYAEPHRKYHDVRHLTEVLGALDLLGGDRTARFAAWFHDAVYDPRRTDNENRSADLAAELLAGHLPPAQVADVARLVRVTADHQPPDGDRAGAILCDADLAILGASPPRYDGYAAAVRAEYCHVTDTDFARGRTAVLLDLLAHQPLYRTAAAQRRWARAARQNISRELTRWAE